ncbi:MAG: 4Fe-4S dicluster domain-containing protein [Cytophagaceae bacterium]
MKHKNVTPVQLALQTITSLGVGLRLTFKHFFSATKRRQPVGVMDDAYFKQPEGIVTTEYPHEAIPLPDNGRYQLHNEISDCIVCDLCAKICPVNCIEIDPIKSPVEIGKTSDGSTKRIYAATFDIDMAKCMYCGLCTTVCPTECLTMTKTFDFSVYDVKQLVFPFAELTTEEAEVKRKEVAVLMEEEKAKKAAAAAAKAATTSTDTEATPKPATPKPSMGKPAIGKPVIKPAAPKEEPSTTTDNSSTTTEVTPTVESTAPKMPPKLKPVIPKKPIETSTGDSENESSKNIEENYQKAQDIQPIDSAESKPTPKVMPKLKPVIPKKPATEQSSASNEVAPATPTPESNVTDATNTTSEEVPKPKVMPKLKPVIPKLKKPDTDEGGTQDA